MAKLYGMIFGSGNPANFTGLSPTFLVFSAFGTSAITPPGITETPVGTGQYQFTYEPTVPVVFTVDGGATVTSSGRYNAGILDPIQKVDEQLTALGNTLIAQISIGNSGIALSIGSTADSFGSTGIDPGSVFGYLKRLQENFEGNAIFSKNSGQWYIYSRGSSTLLIEKFLTDSPTQSTKS